jgi:hypothetical protein
MPMDCDVSMVGDPGALSRASRAWRLRVIAQRVERRAKSLRAFVLLGEQGPVDILTAGEGQEELISPPWVPRSFAASDAVATAASSWPPWTLPLVE